MSLIDAVHGGKASKGLVMGLQGKGDHVVDLFAAPVLLKEFLLQFDRCGQFYPDIEFLPGDAVERLGESIPGIVVGKGAQAYLISLPEVG